VQFPARIPLVHSPTPIEKLERLTRVLEGPEIWVKRDDQTGLATGGNKARKLEFILADAVANRCDHLVTLGGPQSNHCRQTAAASARHGMGCTVVLRGQPPAQHLGNLLLDDLLGATIVWAGDHSREEVADETANELWNAGHRPYVIPLGGSTPLGALGYVVAMEETLKQMVVQNMGFDAMVVASSSGGTQAGLVLGRALFGYPGRILGVSIDAPADELCSRISRIATNAARLLSADASRLDLAEVNDSYLGAGYAVVGDLERDTIRTVAQAEGLLLDPVYTGRAMGGLIDLIRRGAFKRGERILFWHTGGVAALSAFAGELIEPERL
jgi:D-cysteine desulfhydrase family pyridoxal phosphate-dependent enzyme